MYVDVARTYTLFVRNKRKIFHDIHGYIFFTTYRNCIASRVYETCSQLCILKKCLILLHPSANMTFHCYLHWIWGPNNMTVIFFLEHVSQSCRKGFLKASVGDTKPDMHFKERDPHPTPPHRTSCVASTMSASSRNVIITPPHTPPTSYVASTMSASSRNATPPHPTPDFLRSINHAGKFKERDHYPTPPHPQLLA